MESPQHPLQIARIQPEESSLAPVYVTYRASKKRWVLLADYRLVYQDEEGKRVITFLIPANFEFDLASIPRFFWPIISSFELSIVAPLIHDYFYRYEGNNPCHMATSDTQEGLVSQRVTRPQADEIFYNLMLLEGVPKWKAQIAYRVVRVFATRW